MPSSRAVLADITDLKLDPTVAYTTTHVSGRLSKPIIAEPVAKPAPVEKPTQHKAEAPVVVVTEKKQEIQPAAVKIETVQDMVIEPVEEPKNALKEMKVADNTQVDDKKKVKKNKDDKKSDEPVSQS